MKKLPHNFLMRAMWRLGEIKSGRAGAPKAQRCYYEHESDSEKEACTKLHMKYNEKFDFGTFG